MLLAFIFLCIGAALFGVYSHVWRKHTLLQQQQAELEALIEQRAVLLPEFAERMHSHWPQERQPLMRLPELAQRSTHGPRPERMRADQAISNLLTELLELAKQTPQIEASKPLERLEKELELARERCEQATEALSTATRVFPASAVAAQLGVSHYTLDKRRPS